jgi:hypothetical protein
MAGNRPLCGLYALGQASPSKAYVAVPYSDPPKNRRKAMSDILGLVLGVGGIMLMAAYLVLCERI